MDVYVVRHSGIKGMKWGVRRYQNKDGSLTPAGRKRYADDGATSDDHVRARSKSVSTMTDKELNDAVVRLQREKTYKNLYDELIVPKKSEGSKFVNKLIDKSIEASTQVIADKVVKTGVDALLGKGGDFAYYVINKSSKGAAFLDKMGITESRALRNMERETKKRKIISEWESSM